MFTPAILAEVKKQFTFMLTTFGVPAKIDRASKPGVKDNISIAISTQPGSPDNPVVNSSDSTSATFTSASPMAEQDRVYVIGKSYTIHTVKPITINGQTIAYKAQAKERVS